MHWRLAHQPRACRLVDRPGPSAEDQAAGLRRMFGERPPQVVAFASGDNACGRTPLLVRTALALADSGQKVVLVDENPGPGNAIAELGVRVEGDLWDSLIGRIPLTRLVIPVKPNLWVLPAHGLAARLHQDSPKIREALSAVLVPLQAASNFVLIDSFFPKGGHLSLLSSTAYHMAVVIEAQGTSITDAYALIKRLANERGREGFHAVITRGKSAAVSQKVFENVRRTAREHLGVRVDMLGSIQIPAAENLADALCSRLPLPVSGT